MSGSQQTEQHAWPAGSIADGLPELEDAPTRDSEVDLRPKRRSRPSYVYRFLNFDRSSGTRESSTSHRGSFPRDSSNAGRRDSEDGTAQKGLLGSVEVSQRVFERSSQSTQGRAEK